MPGIAICLFFTLLLSVSTSSAEDASSIRKKTVDESSGGTDAFAERVPPPTHYRGTGSVEGRVLYRADAERPWRYARYYVKDRHEGQLAEAVVALETTALERGPSEKAATLVVDQKDFQFTPETAAIRASDSVKFLNSDKEVHNVQTFHPQHSFNINMPAGGEHVETFRQAGGIEQPYRIGCIYHSAMRSWIFVFDHPYYQVTKTDGRFRLAKIPPGEYTLQMVHPAGQLRWQRSIQVEADETTQLDIVVSPDNKPQKRP
ncbi:MAG: carboxypeptidase regulatory-like domain-containing protein [Planctomycetes bacterium]|nr:carboxypeptidase regulatory-like domain-containing protein [Planctomycetota bacterium]